MKSSFLGKIWMADNEVASRTEQSFKRTSPLNACATTTTTTTTTGGGALTHPHLSPPIAAPVTTPDHRSPTSLRTKLAISPEDNFNDDLKDTVLNPLPVFSSRLSGSLSKRTLRTKCNLGFRPSEIFCRFLRTSADAGKQASKQASKQANRQAESPTIERVGDLKRSSSKTL
ncbi:hypothetical protein M0802_006681 [Mischocyttarus mexicanus]|nr:hypothetical protein M0802_006681 [Mischocyttarus mexicanus]